MHADMNWAQKIRPLMFGRFGCFFIVLLCLGYKSYTIEKPIYFSFKWHCICKGYKFVGWAAKLSLWVVSMKLWPNFLIVNAQRLILPLTLQIESLPSFTSDRIYKTVGSCRDTLIQLLSNNLTRIPRLLMQRANISLTHSIKYSHNCIHTKS